MTSPSTSGQASLGPQVLRTTFLRDFRDLSQYSQQVLVFPPRQEAATVDALSFTFFLGLEQTQRHLAQPGKVLRTIAGPMSLLVLAETDIQHRSRSPVLCIPDQGCSIAHHETQGTEVLPELSALAGEV